MKKRYIVVPAVIVLIVTFYFILRGKGDIVATADNDEIMRAEFIVYFLGQISVFEARGGADIWDMDFDGESPEEVAKRNTISNIVMVKQCVKQAKKMRIELTDEETANAYEKARNFLADIPEAVAEENGIEISVLNEIMLENVYYSKLFDSVTGNLEIEDITEIEEYARQYVENEGFNMDSADGQAMYALALDSYVLQRKQQYFMYRYNSWTENVEININPQVYNSITVSELSM